MSQVRSIKPRGLTGYSGYEERTEQLLLEVSFRKKNWEDPLVVPPVVRTLSGSTAVLQSLVGETVSSLWCGKKKKKKKIFFKSHVIRRDSNFCFHLFLKWGTVSTGHITGVEPAWLRAGSAWPGFYLCFQLYFPLLAFTESTAQLQNWYFWYFKCHLWLSIFHPSH